MSREFRSVPNYTNAALVMGVVNLTWMLTVILAVWGWGAVIFTALGLNTLIHRIAQKVTKDDD